MIPTQVAQFLISDYGLTRREALFTSKLLEGKSTMAASQESCLTQDEARTAMNRVLFKVSGPFPVRVKPKISSLRSRRNNGLTNRLSPRTRDVRG